MARPILVRGNPLDDETPRRLIRVEEPEAEAQTPAVGWAKASIRALQDQELSNRDFRILIALESYCWGEDREAWPTNKTIGRRAGGIGPESVRQALRQLERRGYLRIETDPKKWRGSRIVLLYRLIGAGCSEQA